MANTFAGLGFSREAPSVLEFPLEMFLPASDLRPLSQNLDKVVYGLTQWHPSAKGPKLESPAAMVVEAADYEQALIGLNNLFLKNLWGDGLPSLPPTEERVKWLLTGTPLAPDTVIGRVLPQGRVATVETLAVNLAMAGGRPEYMPFLIAAVEAIIDPGVMHQVFSATTCSVYPAMVVNGPAARQVRLNSGYGCLGPSPRYPAGASIGRAVRLVLLNVGGSVPGTGSMAIFGGANKYTNIIFAEDEDGLPAGWEPLNVSYFSYPRGTNTVAVHPVASTVNLLDTSVSTPEMALATLHIFASFMSVPNFNYWVRSGNFEGAPGIALIARETAQGLARFGWSKEKVQAFLWENSKVPWKTVAKASPPHMLKKRIEANQPHLRPNEPWPITRRPENIMIAVAGGRQSGHGYWMQLGTSFKPTCKEVKLPPNWDDLLKKAERDIGPLPSAQ